MSASQAIGAFLTVLLALAVLAVATRNLDDPRVVTGWARAHGLDLTTGNIGLVQYFVRLVVVLRVIGGLSGWATGSALDHAIGTRTANGGGFWLWFLGGWMVGAWWADRSVALPVGPGDGALLSSRRLADYLPWYLRWAPAAGAAASVGLAVAGIVAPADALVPHRRVLVGLAAVAVAIAGLAALGQRSVVARRQPARDPGLIAADDAVRANAVHHLGGGATAATLLVASYLLARPELGGSDAVRATLSLVAVVGALVAWRVLAFRGWRVRRTAGPLGAAS